MSSDVALFLVLHLCLLLAFTSAAVKMFEPEEYTSNVARSEFGTTKWPSWANLDDYAGCEGVDGRVFGNWGDSFIKLIEGSLVSEGFFDCVRESSRPYALPLMYLYFCLTTLLGLNLLIAMMAKSFDTIYESATSQYLFLFSQTTLELLEAPPTPPPFYIFSLPYDLFFIGFPAVARQICVAQVDGKGQPELPAFHANDVRSLHHRDALAKQITDYIVEYQDDVAPEGRFRTALNKKMTERHHKQLDESARRSSEVHDDIQKVHRRMDCMCSELQRVVEEVQRMALLMQQQAMSTNVKEGVQENLLTRIVKADKDAIMGCRDDEGTACVEGSSQADVVAENAPHVSDEDDGVSGAASQNKALNKVGMSSEARHDSDGEADDLLTTSAGRSISDAEGSASNPSSGISSVEAADSEADVRAIWPASARAAAACSTNATNYESSSLQGICVAPAASPAAEPGMAPVVATATSAATTSEAAAAPDVTIAATMASSAASEDRASTSPPAATVVATWQPRMPASTCLTDVPDFAFQAYEARTQQRSGPPAVLSNSPPSQVVWL
mmetsp:Transcript_29621/g.76520  ORF Transcript_29621/g.76520 Transcript_29621/m.76520 type:complete len:557 (+) Transcript_29621:1847-3517(+)